ncbi:hypothetical protein OEA41_001816 [Lepraria neglecta]|uniref:Uncharacterized protein n=1 Tax=Lepraria neglecta TaxID=209136 RepID=A0AAE0DM85_9LECA|nr:hypothetical protein OEA41_001816 [Lepraria neglecta]
MFTLSLDQSRHTRLSCEGCGRQMFGLGRSTTGFTLASVESAFPTRTTSGEEDSLPKTNELLETTADTNTAGARGANPHKTQALQPESASTSDTNFSRKEKQSQPHAEQQESSPPDREAHEDRHADHRPLHREKTLQRQAIGRNCRCMDECLCQRFSVAVEAPETARSSGASSLEGSDPEHYSLSDLRRPESPFHAFDLSLKHMGDWISPNADSPANTRTGNSDSSLSDVTQSTEPTTVDTGIGAEHLKPQGRSMHGHFESRSKDWELRNRRGSSIFRSSRLAPGSVKPNGIRKMPSLAEDPSPKPTTKIGRTTSSAGELAQKEIGNTTSNIADSRDTQRNDIHPDDDPRLTRLDNKLVRLRWRCALEIIRGLSA